MRLFAGWLSWKRYGNCGCDAFPNKWEIRSSWCLFLPTSSLRNERYLCSCFLSFSMTISLLFCKVLARAFKPFAISLNACLLDLTCLTFLYGTTTNFLLPHEPGSQHFIHFLLLFHFPILCFLRFRQLL